MFKSNGNKSRLYELQFIFFFTSITHIVYSSVIESINFDGSKSIAFDLCFLIVRVFIHFRIVIYVKVPAKSKCVIKQTNVECIDEIDYLSAHECTRDINMWETKREREEEINDNSYAMNC